MHLSFLTQTVVKPVSVFIHDFLMNINILFHFLFPDFDAFEGKILIKWRKNRGLFMLLLILRLPGICGFCSLHRTGGTFYGVAPEIPKTRS
jgi:hypothetical protein